MSSARSKRQSIAAMLLFQTRTAENSSLLGSSSITALPNSLIFPVLSLLLAVLALSLPLRLPWLDPRLPWLALPLPWPVVLFCALQKVRSAYGKDPQAHQKVRLVR